MEVELKYRIKEKDDISRILQDDYIKSVIEKDSYEEIPMRAIYFDTEDKKLLKEKIAFRVRKEDNKNIATLKWGGSASIGLHVREEINVPIIEEEFLENPKLKIFEGSNIEDILKVVGENEKLKPLLVMNFIRKQVRIDTGRVICELSIDDGNIISGNKETDILELEIELYSGSEEDLIAIGNNLKSHYSIIEEDKSKFQRGLELINV